MKFDRITTNPNRMNGQPCIRDLRLTVSRVLQSLALYSYFPTDLLAEYPELEGHDIEQALEYAAEMLNEYTVSQPNEALDIMSKKELRQHIEMLSANIVGLQNYIEVIDAAHGKVFTERGELRDRVKSLLLEKERSIYWHERFEKAAGKALELQEELSVERQGNEKLKTALNRALEYPTQQLNTARELNQKLEAEITERDETIETLQGEIERLNAKVERINYDRVDLALRYAHKLDENEQLKKLPEATMTDLLKICEQEFGEKDKQDNCNETISALRADLSAALFHSQEIYRSWETLNKVLKGATK